MKKTVKRSLSLVFVIALLSSLFVVPASAYFTYTSLPFYYGDVRSYTIIPASNTSKALDLWGNMSEDGTNIQTYASNWTDAQIFTIEHVKDGWYKIMHTASGKVLDVEGVNPASGTNVFLWSYHGGDNQLWKFIRDGDGYRIKSKLGTYLDASASGNVWAYEGNNDSGAQLWYLMDASKHNARLVNDHEGDMWPTSNYYAMAQDWEPVLTVQFRGKNLSSIRFSSKYLDGTPQLPTVYGAASGLHIEFVENSMSLTGSDFNTGTVKLKIRADRQAIGSNYMVAISLAGPSGSFSPVYTFTLHVYE